MRWAFPNVLKRAVALLSSCREALEAEAQKVAQLAVNAEGSVNKYKKALEDWGADLAAAQVGCPVYSCAPLVGTLPRLEAACMVACCGRPRFNALIHAAPMMHTLVACPLLPACRHGWPLSCTCSHMPGVLHFHLLAQGAATEAEVELAEVQAALQAAGATTEEQAAAGPTATAAAGESAAADEAAEEAVSLEDQLWQRSQELQLAKARIAEVEQKVRTRYFI